MDKCANEVQAPRSKPALESSPNMWAVQLCSSSGKASWPVGQGLARSNMLDFISDHWVQCWGDVATSLPRGSKQVTGEEEEEGSKSSRWEAGMSRKQV